MNYLSFLYPNHFGIYSATPNEVKLIFGIQNHLWNTSEKSLFVLQVPERPMNETDRHEWIEWTSELLPITYAGVSAKPFFGLALLVDGKFLKHFLIK